MSEEKYPTWSFITVPPYHEWYFPVNVDVFCVLNQMSIFDINVMKNIRDTVHNEKKKFGGVVCDFIVNEYLYRDELADKELPLDRIVKVIREVAPDYAVCAHLYDRYGTQFPHPIDANTMLTAIGHSTPIGAKVAYLVDASSLEEKHIARIYEMKRDGQIDTLVVRGRTDKTTQRVLSEIEYLGVEIGRNYGNE